LLLGLNAKMVSQAAGTAVDVVIGTDLAVGEMLILPHQNVTNLVISGVGVALSPTMYRPNLKHGSIEGRVAQAGVITASYTYGATRAVAMLAATSSPRWVRFEGINLADNSYQVVDLYKCKFSPLKDLSLIGDTFAELTLEAKVLLDGNQDPEGELGQFGRMALIEAD